MEYLWDLNSVRIAIETAGVELISMRVAPTWRANYRCEK
jgi:hypothetical protein